MSDSLGSNLKLLCSHYRSIAEVCRKLSINRAQFNRYLAGQSRPTTHNLKRICDFFGVEPFELAMPAEQFTRLIGARSGAAQQHSGSDPLLELFAPLRRQASPMERYCGYYFEYSNCMSVPGSVLISLVHLREEDGSYWTGLVFADGKRWPEERTTWTGAAMILAADALSSTTPAAGIFRSDLPRGLEGEFDCACATSGPAGR